MTNKLERKGKGKGSRLTSVDKALVYQAYLLLQNKSQVAEKFGYSVQTVNSAIRSREAAETTVPERQARADVAARVMGKILVKSEEMLDHIKPQDMESGRIPLTDKNGNITGYQSWGPALSQKALAFGIMLDKAAVAENLGKAILSEQHSGQLLIPQDLEGLRDAIMGKVKSLKVLQVDFAHDAPGVLDRTQEILERVEVAKAEEPAILDFDNVSTDAGK